MPIRILSPQVANQISAGEIVDRPSSVVKELIENSIDAGATRIDINIEHGGSKLIRIRDNGCGIKKDELVLALSRHATSKISTLKDLEAIVTLGFRGEALASISSVSRLKLISRTSDQKEAWYVYLEGQDTVIVNPAAHPVGTTLEVRDLFYNTPARRKFMRTEKTEFKHIHEVIRRIALARFDVAINLSHNGKVVRKYCMTSAHCLKLKERRLITIFGSQFIKLMQVVQWEHDSLRLFGWLIDPKFSGTAFTDIQYCYVNGRIVRNRLIKHAIRQVYGERLGADQHPAFIIYLMIDPRQVDVNVHPTKYEIHFHQSRLVHDFIYYGVLQTLCQSESALLKNRVIAGCNQFSKSVRDRESTLLQYTEKVSSLDHVYTYPICKKQKVGFLQEQSLALCKSKSVSIARQINTLKSYPYQSFGRVLTIIDSNIALLERNGQLALIALRVAERCLKQAQLNPIYTRPLLIPLRLKITLLEIETIERYQNSLVQIGIEITIKMPYITVRAVPILLRKQNLQNLIPELIGYLAEQTSFNAANTTQWIANHLMNEHPLWRINQAITLLTELEQFCPQLVKTPSCKILQPIDLQSAKNALLKDE